MNRDCHDNFAPSEITEADTALITSSADSEPESALGDLLKESREFDSSSFFSEEHLKETFIQSYRVQNAIIAGGDGAVELALKQPPFDQRKRAIPRDRPELIGITIVAKPQNEKQRKQCSSHACVLKAARMEQVSNEAFPAWLDDPNNGVKNCRQRVAKKRRRAAELPPQPPRSKPASAPRDQLWLRFGVGKGREIGLENLAFVPRPIYAEVEELIKSLTYASKVSEVLRSLADLIASTEFVRALSIAPEAPIQPEGPEAKRDGAGLQNILHEPPERDGYS